MHLTAGDAVVFPQGDAHRMNSQPGLPPAKGTRLDEVLSRRPRLLAYGGGGATTRLICGYLACDARLARMLLAGLPPLVRVNVRGSNAGIWLEASVRYALAEARSPRPGGAGVLAKLAEVLFIEVLRLYMNEQSDGPHRLARGGGRSHRRRRAERAARAPRARLDARRAGARRGHVEIGARRALPASRGELADAVPHAVADAARRESPVAAATRRSRASPKTSATRPTRRSAARSGASTARRRRRGAASQALS